MLPGVPFRAQSRRERHAFSEPDPLSPLDSGYGSASPPPSTSKRSVNENRPPSAELRILYDGNQSDSDDPFVDSDQENLFANVADISPGSPSAAYQTPQGFLRGSATLPRQSPRSRPGLPGAFFPSYRSRSQQRAPNTASVRRLDRFIPARPLGTEASERFKTGKAPHELTSTERLLRHSGATEDAFVYRRRVVTPFGFRPRSISRGETAASRNTVGNVLGPLDQNSIDGNETQVDANIAWTVGLGGTAVNNGRGQLVRSGTNARLFRTTFPTAKPKTDEELEKHKARLAAALGLDRAHRVLEVNAAIHHGSNRRKPGYVHTHWNGTEWVNDGPIPKPQKPFGNRTLPTAPFKVLDAPNLRDDFYCSVLAYSSTSRTLAVGLGNLLYGWSETRGVQLLNTGTDPDCYLTSLSFSSAEGCKSILAFGRSDKTLGLMSLYDGPHPASSRAGPKPRFEVIQPTTVACLSWKPSCTVRPSKDPVHLGIPVKNEDLLVGDETGLVYYYAVEWPERWEVERRNWPGNMTLLARIAAHSQQICGLAWSKNGDVFGTGGNDNLCCVFETTRVLEAHAAHCVLDEDHQAESSAAAHVRGDSEVSEAQTEIQVSQSPIYDPTLRLGPGDEKHRWVHGAAVKAIAFCPWQESLVATGGGSNDKCIHFFHTGSGAALASISVSAQVTSLIWSTTRREIAATFGYAQPDHPVRIAVFSWPDCRQVAAIPWAGEHRALYAIPYPCGPDEIGPSGLKGKGRAKKAPSLSRTAKEGCIIVASSDKSVKFHEVWTAGKKGTAGVAGVLGGSPILEFLEGIDREGEVIR
ncbi:WD40 repeat-like protein [Parathielavia appendiculata]|uniref:WD40 repeat-like protein n=1 Tax=Parathielavia appendiculata TaxID=2587402 RepID=A0AAN6TRD6_9PEZI|nr:WD40 repeat-like protein [Parathielavia appendiculata]